MSVIGGVLSGSSWSAGRAWVEGNEMVLFVGRWIYLGHSNVAVAFCALLILDIVALTIFIKMGIKNRRLVLSRSPQPVGKAKH